jgi:glutamate formiminotransferase
MLECVVNVSEGRDLQLINELGAAAGAALLDVHSDPHHNRSVLTIIGEEPARTVVAAAVRKIDLRLHTGVHPRLGAADVVPFAPLATDQLDDAIVARARTARWLGSELGVPCFLYGPERTLPEVRRQAFVSLRPDSGPPAPHPTAGASAVGARPLLVAYNVWLDAELEVARRVASEVRGPTLRALGLQVGDRVQVSMNLLDPAVMGPDDSFDRVAAAARSAGADVAGAELVGLLPASVLATIPEHRWAELDLAPERTIEARLERAGLV